MEYFAEVDDTGVVLRVLVVDEKGRGSDGGHQWLLDNLGGTWVKVDPYTRQNHRVDPQTNQLTDELGLRGNYPSPGFIYDKERDIFYSPKPYNSWLFDDAFCEWVPPILKPMEQGFWEWVEEEQRWRS